ncbi:unnamed protein product, partial [Iphiclides podalirius]
MSTYEYVGDTENISQRHLQFVSEVLEKHGYTGKQVAVTSMGKVGDNYGSYAKRFSAEFENGKVFKMVAKIAPPNHYLGVPKQQNDLFTNEMVVYNEILPKFRQLQESAGVPEEDRLQYPHCYGTLSETQNEIILLEDLDSKGYVMLDKRQPLSDSSIKAVLHSLANFHSMSYVLKNREPQTYDRLSATMVNAFTNPETASQSQMMFQAAWNDMKAVFDNERHTHAINDTLQHLVEVGMHIQTADRGSKYSVIQHGDLWTNNIMFQMQGDQPVACIMIDYQLSKESLPAADIHNLIFNCTDYKTRSKHYYEWIDYYHSELDRCLNNFGLKVSYVYPRDKFDADLKRYGKPYLGMAFMMLNVLLRPTQEALQMSVFESSDMTKMVEGFGMQNLMEQTLDEIKKRVDGLVDSCFEYGYLTEVPKARFK